MSTTKLHAHWLRIRSKWFSRLSNNVVQILIAVAASLVLASTPAAAAPVYAPSAICHVVEPTGIPTDEVDRLIGRGVAALRTGTEKTAYDAIDAFVDAVNSVPTNDERFGIAMDGLGCAFLQKAALQDAPDLSETAVPVPTAQSALSEPRDSVQQSPSFKLCSTIGADIDNASAAFMMNGRNRELLAQLRGHHQPVPGACTNPVKVTIESDTYQAHSGQPIRTPSLPQGEIMISNRLDPGETHELAWIELMDHVILIYLHPGHEQDEATLPLARPDTYGYKLELKSFYDADGGTLPRTRSRPDTISLIGGDHLLVLECPYDDNLVWLGHAY